MTEPAITTTATTTVTVTVAGQPTTIATGGAGPPLLYLHPEADNWAWGAVHDELAGSFTVVAPVHPGFGGDELPPWLDDVSDITFHHIDLLHLLGLDEPLVVGVSLGGWMAVDLAIHRSDLLAGVVLVGALGLRPATPAPDLFLMEPPEVMAHLAHSIDGDAVDPLTGDVDRLTRLWVEQATQARLMWERPYDRRLERRAHHVRCPVAVVWGGDDRLLPVEHGRRLGALFGVEPEVVAGAGHLVSVDDPGAVARAAVGLQQRAVEE